MLTLDSRPPRAVVSAFLAVSVLALAACGDDDGSADRPTGPADEQLTVVARDIAFDAETYEVEAGTVAITYENDGNLPHSLVIEGVGGQEIRAKPHDSDEATVELEPGSYTIYCDVPGHRSAGMEATIEVS